MNAPDSMPKIIACRFGAECDKCRVTERSYLFLRTKSGLSSRCQGRKARFSVKIFRFALFEPLVVFPVDIDALPPDLNESLFPDDGQDSLQRPHGDADIVGDFLPLFYDLDRPLKARRAGADIELVGVDQIGDGPGIGRIGVALGNPPESSTVALRYQTRSPLMKLQVEQHTPLRMR